MNISLDSKEPSSEINIIDYSQPLLKPIEIQPKKKRDDLQCWRSVAIIGVLLFHVWPQWFPNGYLGVDIFFVLSGFLMATIVHKQSKIDVATIIDFYYRRIKRIVPIYLTFMIIAILCISQILWKDEFDNVLRDFYWASGFMTNIQTFVQKLDYFDMQSQHQFFRHCWSLAVEMQFYLLVPFLFSTWMNFFPKYKLQLMFILFIFSLFYENTHFFYESTFSRIWQFSAGIIAQSYPIKMRKSFLSLIFLVSLFSVFVPMALMRPILSFSAVVSSSLVIAASTDGSDSPFSGILSLNLIGRGFVFLGDISYVLYLVHWPIISYIHFTILEEYLEITNGFLVIILSLIVGVIFHIVIEKPLLYGIKTKWQLFSSTILLYLFLFGSLEVARNYTYGSKSISKEVEDFYESLYDFNSNPKKPSNWSIQDDFQVSLKLMNDFSNHNFKCLQTCEEYTKIKFRKYLHFCETRNPESTMNLSAVIVGNSHAITSAPIVHMDERFSRVIRISGSGCSFPDRGGRDVCNDTLTIAFQVLEKVKPDITFLFFAYFGPIIRSHKAKTGEKDLRFLILNNTVGEMSKYTKSIIISELDVRYPFEVTPEFLRRRKNGLETESLIIKRNVEKERDIKKVLKLVRKHCPICTTVSPHEAFCDKEYCDPIDRNYNLPMLRDHGHIHVLGCRRYKPIVDNAISQALSIVNPT